MLIAVAVVIGLAAGGVGQAQAASITPTKSQGSQVEARATFLPLIGLGLERDRQRWIYTIDEPEMLRLTVWNPAEFSNYRHETVHWDLTDIDPELARAISAIPENDDDAPERGRVTLNRAARRLQQLDWRLIAPVTDDFVVFAVDYELTHLEENLRHSVPAALRKALSSRALV